MPRSFSHCLDRNEWKGFSRVAHVAPGSQALNVKKWGGSLGGKLKFQQVPKVLCKVVTSVPSVGSWVLEDGVLVKPNIF